MKATLALRFRVCAAPLLNTLRSPCYGAFASGIASDQSTHETLPGLRY